jgi:uncharacterized surface protein with fasciclin (FAS1) repeats
VPVSVSETLAALKLSGFANLLAQANLSASIDSLSSITVFVPSNAAIAAAGISSLTPSEAINYANAHIIPNFVGYLPLLKDGATYPTLGGGVVTISVKNGAYFVNGAEIVVPDVIIDSGVMHVIDKVSLILPLSLREAVIELC